MEIDLIFKIAAVGIIVSILNQVLVRSGREEQATMTTLAGLVVVLMILVQKIADLFDLVKTCFSSDGYDLKMCGNGGGGGDSVPAYPEAGGRICGTGIHWHRTADRRHDHDGVKAGAGIPRGAARYRRAHRKHHRAGAEGHGHWNFDTDCAGDL